MRASFFFSCACAAAFARIHFSQQPCVSSFSCHRVVFVCMCFWSLSLCALVVRGTVESRTLCFFFLFWHHFLTILLPHSSGPGCRTGWVGRLIPPWFPPPFVHCTRGGTTALQCTLCFSRHKMAEQFQCFPPDVFRHSACGWLSFLRLLLLAQAMFSQAWKRAQKELGCFCQTCQFHYLPIPLLCCVSRQCRPWVCCAGCALILQASL